jgi:quinone-modifying oxidoreductase subunit QmoC
MAMQDVALGLVKAKRLNPLEAVGISHKCKDIKGIHAMLDKARELEAKRKGRTA